MTQYVVEFSQSQIEAAAKKIAAEVLHQVSTTANKQFPDRWLEEIAPSMTTVGTDILKRALVRFSEYVSL